MRAVLLPLFLLSVACLRCSCSTMSSGRARRSCTLDKKPAPPKQLPHEVRRQRNFPPQDEDEPFPASDWRVKFAPSRGLYMCPPHLTLPEFEFMGGDIKRCLDWGRA